MTCDKHNYQPRYVTKAYPMFECANEGCDVRTHNLTCADGDGLDVCVCGLEDLTKWEQQFAKEGTS